MIERFPRAAERVRLRGLSRHTAAHVLALVVGSYLALVELVKARVMRQLVARPARTGSVMTKMDVDGQWNGHCQRPCRVETDIEPSGNVNPGQYTQRYSGAELDK